jgi:hypothetical protein
MITKLTLRNFKSIKEETYDFTSLDLFVGWNNSGKSTVLQSLAIWQFCVDEFRRSKRAGKKGIQIILPNFTALPVPVFNLLWHNKTDRKYPDNPEKPDKKIQQFITIDIEVTWRAKDKEHTFGVALRYHSAQTVYAIPKTDWDTFRKLDHESELPIIAYVPPFSGLEPQEERRDDAPLRKQIGKAQPGSVLRNLLLKVTTAADKKNKGAADWQEIVDLAKRWFSVDLLKPQYEDGKDTFITCEYKQRGETYDIIAGGSGFHQTITLLAFLYGYHPTTILLDEPDAHLHVNLQREILDLFQNQIARARCPVSHRDTRGRIHKGRKHRADCFVACPKTTPHFGYATRVKGDGRLVQHGDHATARVSDNRLCRGRERRARVACMGTKSRRGRLDAANWFSTRWVAEQR